VRNVGHDVRMWQAARATTAVPTHFSPLRLSISDAPEVASYLNLSARTIEMRVALALERLNCHTRSEAVSRATSQGLLGLKD
jgi:hypothetical protein